MISFLEFSKTKKLFHDDHRFIHINVPSFRNHVWFVIRCNLDIRNESTRGAIIEFPRSARKCFLSLSVRSFHSSDSRYCQWSLVLRFFRDEGLFVLQLFDHPRDSRAASWIVFAVQSILIKVKPINNFEK